MYNGVAIIGQGMLAKPIAGRHYMLLLILRVLTNMAHNQRHDYIEPVISCHTFLMNLTCHRMVIIVT